MSRKDDIKKLIVNYERRLQRLKEQQASLGVHTLPHILNEIEDIKTAIEELQTDLKALESKDVNKETLRASAELAEDTTPKRRVMIYIVGDISLLSADRQSAAIDGFAGAMGISRQEIEVYHVSPGSIVFELGIPPYAIQYLRSRLRSNSAQLRLLKVEKVILERGSGETEEWVIEKGKYYLVTSTRSIISSGTHGKTPRADNALQVRNEIYRYIFNKDWITGLILLVFALVGVLIYSQWEQQRVQQAETLIAPFRNATSADERIMSLAGLFDNNFGDQARILFGELNTDERLALFRQAHPEAVGPQLTTVVQGLYMALENNERDNMLLAAMAASLDKVEDNLRAEKLQLEIEQWLLGRQFYNKGKYEQAIEVYSAVINQNDRNPGIYFDRGLAHAAQGNAAAALADFNQVLELDTSENRQMRVSQTIMSHARLYDAVMANPNKNQILVALVPSPTSTPTATFTPTSTNTPTPTPTVTSTPTKTPTATATSMATSTPESPPVLPETSPETSTSLPTSTFVPSPIPRPATLVYVQSNRATHNIGLVGSDGQLFNAQLHELASAPAWSPDGTEVAFYGEPGISQLGGIYAQGAGIWIINVQTSVVRLLYQIDHVRNMDWSPDGTKLAFEFSPPGGTAQIIILDLGGAQEVSRFPGEQPTWSPDSSQLVIKSCQPECGLWLVGIDGSSVRLLTNNSTASYPDWSPDGTYIVYTSRGDIGDWEIYRLELATGQIKRLTNQPGTDTTPVFSPDGIEIYWRTDAHGSWQIRKMARDGSNDRLVIDDLGPSDDWGLARPAVR